MKLILLICLVVLGSRGSMARWKCDKVKGNNPPDQVTKTSRAGDSDEITTPTAATTIKLITPSPTPPPPSDCRTPGLQSRSVSYAGYEVLSVNVTTPKVYEALKTMYLEEKYDFWSFWASPTIPLPTDIMVSPAEKETLKSHLKSMDAKYIVMITNLEDSINREKAAGLSNRQAGTINWDAFQTLETIYAWMDSMAVQHPKLVTVTSYGTSSEGRDLKVMKISTAGPDSNRPAVWLDSGIHAREWITHTTATYIANELITLATKSPIPAYVDNCDWYIVPSLNPDGYAFTWSGDRYWRKTRSVPRIDKSGKCCLGADANRNFEYKWGGPGAESDQCKNEYFGAGPASEPEVAAAQTLLYKLKDTIKLYITFHSYARVILFSPAYDGSKTADYEELLKVGIKANEAMSKPYGTSFIVGTWSQKMYTSSGVSMDYAKFVAGIKYSYTIELRGGGFETAASNIKPIAEETFLVVQSMTEDVLKP